MAGGSGVHVKGADAAKAASALAASARSGVGVARSGVDAARTGVRRFRKVLRKDGADASGLATLVELCGINAAGDALVAVALAGTVFFNVPVGQARGKVALYLLITMAPFALLAPVIGPALDKLHGRRIAMSASMVGRAVLCWALAGHHDGLELYPLALGLLVTSRAFGIARAACTPRLLPHGTSLLSANSRVTLVGALAGGVVAPIGLGLGAITGISWVLRGGAVVFLCAVFFCLQLPAHVDSAKGETAAIGLTRSTFGPMSRKVVRGSRVSRALGDLPTALRAVLCLRALVGFLTLFLAFELRTAGSSKTSLAGLAAAALVGQVSGVAIGNRLGRRRPELLIASGLMLGTAVCLLGAIAYSRPASLLVALFATGGASMGKLGLDAVIQRDIAESSRASAFARSETALQLSWVAGGAIGLLPISGQAGLAIAASGMVIALAAEVLALRRGRHPVVDSDRGRGRSRSEDSRADRSRTASGKRERRSEVPEVLVRRQQAARDAAENAARDSPQNTAQNAARPAADGPGGTMRIPFDDGATL